MYQTLGVSDNNWTEKNPLNLMQLILTKGKVFFIIPYSPDLSNMEILINNEAFETQAKSLYDLLTEHSLSDQKGIAVAVNNSVIPKANWNIHQLINQDKITVIKATQGG